MTGRHSRFLLFLQRPRDPLTRRDMMDRLAMMLGGVALVAGTASEAEAKMPQKASKYQTTPKGAAKCSNCANFEPPASCGIVDGKISPNGWCRFYAKK